METTRPKPFVFVLMPFENTFDDTYKLGIKQAALDAGGYCERVDEQIFEERMLDRIYNQINKADVIVADLTGRNPNVFYETGYAHALEKRVILLTQKSEDIPFDLKHHYHIVYEGSIVKLKDELARRLQWFFDNPTKHIQPSTQQLEIFFGNIKIKEADEIKFSTDYMDLLDSYFSIRNSSDVIYRNSVKVGILLDYNVTIQSSGFRNIPCPYDKNKQLFVWDTRISEIFPGDSINIPIAIESDGNSAIHITLRFFTEVGIRDTHFSILPILL